MRYDTNKDGFVDRTEWKAGQEARFKRLDTNKDGKLSQEELFARTPGGGNSVLPTDRQVAAPVEPTSSASTPTRTASSAWPSSWPRPTATSRAATPTRTAAPTPPNAARRCSASAERKPPAAACPHMKQAACSSAAFPLSRMRDGATQAALGVHDVAEQLPGLALEALQLDRLDRIEVGRAGVDRDARQQHRHFALLEVRRLLHEVLTRQVVAAPLQRLVHQADDRVGEDV